MTEQMDTLQAITAPTFTVTLENGPALTFTQGTLRQRMAADAARAALTDEVDTATDLIDLVLPVVTAQFVPDPQAPAEILDLINLEQLMEVFAAFKHNHTIDFNAKKNLELR